jgi:hypothetical protein
MFVPHNCANCVCRNERASCFLTPRVMFGIVLWARMECHIRHIGSRMHLHTRAYVTKKPHVRALHVCRSSVNVAGLAGPLRYSAAAANQPQTSHLVSAGTAATAPSARLNHSRELGLGPCSQLQPRPGLCQRRPRPNTGPACKGIGTSSTNTGQGQQGDGQGNKAPSWQERRQR